MSVSQILGVIFLVEIILFPTLSVCKIPTVRLCGDDKCESKILTFNSLFI